MIFKLYITFIIDFFKGVFTSFIKVIKWFFTSTELVRIKNFRSVTKDGPDENDLKVKEEFLKSGIKNEYETYLAALENLYSFKDSFVFTNEKIQNRYLSSKIIVTNSNIIEIYCLTPETFQENELFFNWFFRNFMFVGRKVTLHLNENIKEFDRYKYYLDYGNDEITITFDKTESQVFLSGNNTTEKFISYIFSDPKYYVCFNYKKQ